jgi:predicted HicB family RNase H-like nuclease
MLKHKGYYSEPKYSDEDEVFFGTVEGINDLVTFEAANAHELKEEFINAVDDYLATCEELGKEPEKPYSGNIRLRMGEPLHKRVAMAATSTGESINSYIVHLLQKATSDDRSLA